MDEDCADTGELNWMANFWLLIMATIKNFAESEVRKKARLLYQKRIPLFERIALRSDFRLHGQMKSAAGSVMDNIAEGFEKDSRKELINFPSYAKGSCGEVQPQIYRIFDENIISETEHLAFIKQYKALAKDIGNFIRYLNASDIKGQKFNGR